jgi:DNA sulfur modification protein DndC
MQDIQDAYLSDDRPWVVGFSGGKDSTALLQLTYYAIARLPRDKRRKPIFVLSSDTRVETPQISARIKHELELIQAAAERDGLPLTTHLVFPKLNDTFWVNLIGRGYPSPTNHFRWCTDRLKIYPVSDFIEKVVSRSGSVVVVLGARMDESQTRGQTLRRLTILGQRFRPHADLPRAWVYTPIEELTGNDVWIYLLQVPSPWGSNNKALVGLYKQAGGGECPLVIDTSTPSCGNSRFGCWTCTVVDRDKSMEALIDSGEEQLVPLLNLRDHIKAIRDTPGMRYDHRRNGTVPIRRGTDEAMTNTGPFTHQTRMDLLRRVFEAQRESGIQLIEGDELKMIQEIWNKEENDHPGKPDIPADAVNRIWDHVLKGVPMLTETAKYDHLSAEDQLLREVCEQLQVPFEMMRRLRDIEEEYGHLKRRHGLPEEMREVIRSEVGK